ncbi:hypothetical protein CC1G_05877 [Coprinopsis cinerea okayama7|uniref:Uncharacterized protein n=1 Tax=Coprinopsis cinerea (strain Okayama-7 / 130 / ATCC MYA-4618 / FGSC 9003) TaxID=240176 RepID=A8NAC6_COPC7|nr:hypothetical protein CC1G_05877 [Coprinopsis cinerea okayama7\|eukprot:XP_001831778.2 hypothetical protein CC1G_05877 [Coprinopsis cinerea okayama7\
MSVHPAAVTAALEGLPTAAALTVLRGGQDDTQPNTPASDDSFDVVMDHADHLTHLATAGGTSVFVRNPPRDVGSITGFVCANCNVYNLVRDAKETWYCITTGQRAPSREAALAEWAKACKAGNVKWPGVDNTNPDTFHPAGVAAHEAHLLGDASFPPAEIDP